ncbi:hematopoietic prostaglandin D synthase-like [Dendronephthya gigantea]|uniref:hematopoietic prostaglandin D synthase-like n=1 Tax=Dendronephthya gigantea TaxID=151771 RepID=UPI00106AF219|nr:hematopoietic prostaglandin D synthase-like [Dendronephthya gigantea]
MATSTRPHYKLTYFPLRARAEPIRIILTLAGADWEDNRNMNDDDLAALNEQGVCPYGLLPILEFDGVVLAQSMAILRYLAREYGFLPETSLEIAIADSIVDQIQDCVLKVIKMWFTKDASEKSKAKQDLVEGLFPKNLSYFEIILNKNCKGKTFFFGDKITYADINFFCFVNGFILAGQIEVPPILTKYPGLTKLYKAILNHPRLREYLEKRPPTDGR